MTDEKMLELGKLLNIKFRNIALIKQAFIHRSYLNETKVKTYSNERLEFLGDSILSFLVSEYLFEKYPDFSEGELTNLRSSIVKTATLASAAKQLNLGDYLYLSKGEEESGGRENNSLLADTFEAFLGSVYLDIGLLSVQKILNNLLFPLLTKILADKLYKDAKSNFQELIQENSKISPVYKILSEKGPDHAKEFTIGVFAKDKLWGTGTGKSKQEGEMKAAQAALENWQKK